MHITTTVGLIMEMERRDLCIDPSAEGALKDWAFKHVLPEAAVETAPRATVEAAPQAVFADDEDEVEVEDGTDEEGSGVVGGFVFANPTPSEEVLTQHKYDIQSMCFNQGNTWVYKGDSYVTVFLADDHITSFVDQMPRTGDHFYNYTVEAPSAFGLPKSRGAGASAPNWDLPMLSTSHPSHTHPSHTHPLTRSCHTHPSHTHPCV